MKKSKDKFVKPVYESTQPDYYTVNGIKYIREDLVNSKIDSVMERIAKSLETQTEWFIKKCK